MGSGRSAGRQQATTGHFCGVFLWTPDKTNKVISMTALPKISRNVAQTNKIILSSFGQ